MIAAGEVMHICMYLHIKRESEETNETVLE